MQRAALCWTLFASLGLVAVVGCAVGTDPDGIAESDLLNAPVTVGDENSVVLPPPSHPNEDSGTEDAGTDPDGSTTDGGVDSGPPDAGPPPFTCTSPNTCLTSTDLGSISGDENADFKTFQGSGSQWFTVRVTENDSSVFGTELEMKAELTSPAGTNFDLFIYRAGGTSGQECASLTTSSTSTASFDTASMSWGEGTISNGSSDDRTVTVEVRHISGTCAAAAKWSLTVRGNTL